MEGVGGEGRGRRESEKQREVMESNEKKVKLQTQKATRDRDCMQYCSHSQRLDGLQPLEASVSKNDSPLDPWKGMQPC